MSPAEDNKGAGTFLLQGNDEVAEPVQLQELMTERGPLQHLKISEGRVPRDGSQALIGGASVPSNRRRGNGQKLMLRNLHLNMRKNF